MPTIQPIHYKLRQAYSVNGKTRYMIPSEAECAAHTDGCFWSYENPFWCCSQECIRAREARGEALR